MKFTSELLVVQRPAQSSLIAGEYILFAELNRKKALTDFCKKCLCSFSVKAGPVMLSNKKQSHHNTGIIQCVTLEVNGFPVLFREDYIR